MAEAGVLEMVETETQAEELRAFECDWGGLREAGVQVSAPGCRVLAVWVGTSTCCGEVRFYCDAHRWERDLFVLTARSPAHAKCGAAGAPIRWEPLRKVGA